jgi:enamine deaminase RidA (YjgF/YER057c/UK114 family)
MLAGSIAHAQSKREINLTSREYFEYSTMKVIHSGKHRHISLKEYFMDKEHFSSGSLWEPIVGYSRALRAGHLIFVSGTTAAGTDGTALYPDDAYAQAQEIWRRIASTLAEAGATLDDVVQTRQYVIDISQWAAIGRAHGEVFRQILPTTSMVEVRRLIDPSLLVEIEAIAILPTQEKEK